MPDRTAIVTGASRGVRRRAAPHPGVRGRGRGRQHGRRGRDPRGRRAPSDRFERLEVLVNNAGVGIGAAAADHQTAWACCGLSGVSGARNSTTEEGSAAGGALAAAPALALATNGELCAATPNVGPGPLPRGEERRSATTSAPHPPADCVPLGDAVQAAANCSAVHDVTEHNNSALSTGASARSAG
jgi:hypothetical protein